MSQIIRTTVSLSDKEIEALDLIRDELIEPFFGEHNRTQAINFCIRYTLQNGVKQKQTA